MENAMQSINKAIIKIKDTIKNIFSDKQNRLIALVCLSFVLLLIIIVVPILLNNGGDSGIVSDDNVSGDVSANGCDRNVSDEVSASGRFVKIDLTLPKNEAYKASVQDYKDGWYSKRKEEGSVELNDGYVEYIEGTIKYTNAKGETVTVDSTVKVINAGQ